MIKHYPDFWQEDPMAAAIVDAVAAEAALIRQNTAEILAASSVSTAPEWAVEKWEKAYGITPDATKPLADRRAAVQSLMRGGGIVTPERIRQVVGAFHGGEVAVSEDAANGAFVVEFVDQQGTPPYLADVSAAIRKIKPAHLSFSYAFRYLRVHEVEKMTLAELETMNMDRFAGGTVYG